MGSNGQGQLGIDDPYMTQKTSPVLVEVLVQHKPSMIACGNNHILALMSNDHLILITKYRKRRSVQLGF